MQSRAEAARASLASLSRQAGPATSGRGLRVTGQGRGVGVRGEKRERQLRAWPASSRRPTNEGERAPDDYKYKRKVYK